MNITVEVTKEDIALGKRENCNACPIALAVLRVSKGRAVYVEAASLIAIGAMEYMVEPTSAVEVDFFINSFDSGHKDGLAPFSFELREKPCDEDEEEYDE